MTSGELPCCLGIIAHTNIFLHGVVLIARDKDHAVSSVSKTLGNLACVTLVCLDLVRGRRQLGVKIGKSAHFAGARGYSPVQKKAQSPHKELALF
jgi:hypothetical protein